MRAAGSASAAAVVRAAGGCALTREATPRRVNGASIWAGSETNVSLVSRDRNREGGIGSGSPYSTGGLGIESDSCDRTNGSATTTRRLATALYCTLWPRGQGEVNATVRPMQTGGRGHPQALRSVPDSISNSSCRYSDTAPSPLGAAGALPAWRSARTVFAHGKSG